MNNTNFMVLALCSMLAMQPCFANQQLAQTKNCLACHAVDQKKVGPSFQEIALRYTQQKDVETQLAKKIREGSVGVWGNVPMPASTNVNTQEAQALVKWILKQK